MTETAKKRGLVRTNKARLIAYARWAVVAVAPILLVTLVAWAPGGRLATFERLGLVQPSLAALVALIVVLAMRLGWGRFVHETRKGARSASSATIAVRLWMACFALLLVAMLLSAMVARLPDSLFAQPDPAKPDEARVDVTLNSAATNVAVSVN